MPPKMDFSASRRRKQFFCPNKVNIMLEDVISEIVRLFGKSKLAAAMFKHDVLPLSLSLSLSLSVGHGFSYKHHRFSLPFACHSLEPFMELGTILYSHMQKYCVHRRVHPELLS